MRPEYDLLNAGRFGPIIRDTPSEETPDPGDAVSPLGSGTPAADDS
jgi:hypothetical protein